MSFWSVTLALMEGLITTGELFVLTLVFALPLGLIICFGTMTEFTPCGRWSRASCGSSAARP